MQIAEFVGPVPPPGAFFNSLPEELISPLAPPHPSLSGRAHPNRFVPQSPTAGALRRPVAIGAVVDVWRAGISGYAFPLVPSACVKVILLPSAAVNTMEPVAPDAVTPVCAESALIEFSMFAALIPEAPTLAPLLELP